MDELSRLMALRTAAAGQATPRPQPLIVGDPDLLTSVMDARTDLLAEGGNDSTTWADIRRICGLPVRAPLSLEEAEELSRMYVLESAFRRGFRLWPLQAQAINDFDLERGLLGSIPVGNGKSTIDASIAHLSYISGRRRTLLMMPPETVENFRIELPIIRQRIPLAAPMHFVEGPRHQRAEVYKSRQAGCYVVPISLLSVEDSEEMLHEINPDVVVVDEVHKFKNLHAARTQRLARYITERGKRGTPLEFAGLSGTITSRKLADFWHIAQWSLHAKAPVPFSYPLMVMLAQCLDSDADPSPEQMKRWEPLRRWARMWFPGENLTMDVAGLRRAFQMRVYSAPGAASGNSDSMCDTKLVIRNTPVPDATERPGFDRIKKMMDDVERKFVAPNGDEIDHALHSHKWLRELTAGFYNELPWPSAKTVARRLNVSESDAGDALRKALEHHLVRQEYHVELRKWLTRHHIPKLDTPYLVGTHMHRHGAEKVGADLFKAWRAMKDLEFSDMPERERRAVRVCDYKVQNALRWADQHRDGGILWVYSIEMGHWVYESLKAAGFSQALHCPAGANIAVLDRANRDKLLVCSISSHGTGKNLQFHQHQIFVEWPRSALMVEQVLGRLQRPGQEAELIYADTCDTTGYDAHLRAAALIDALYQGQTTGTPQRAIFCAYEPLPKVFPPAVLRERGFENELLDEYLTAAMREKFVEVPT